MQNAIHEGYEYQDYFSVSIILQLMLQRKDAEIIVDRKDFNGDKFDDLKVKLSNGITEFQIKYSDEESSHNLTKSDLSNGNGHDTALCDLFASWKTRKESENNTEIKLCLAWGRPADDDPIAKFLKPIQEHTMPFSTVAYSFDGAAFWPAEDTPPKTWKKFNLKIKSEPIEREDFLAFCNELTFILEMYRLFKCRKIQPQNHLYDKDNSCEPFLPSNEDEYILIGAFEKKSHIDYKQASCIFAYQGIIGLDDKKQKKPFQECLAPGVETGELYVILDNSEALINLIETLDRELEDENYLWPKNSVFKLFNVHIEFDFLHRRYIAVNQEDDIIFIMKKWSSSYKGDSEYPGNVIPLYSGTELYIKREYIGILEQQFGTLMMETCVEACTQTY